MAEPAFLLELGGVVVALALLARLATRWRLPAAPLFLIAGLSVGEGGAIPLITAQEFIELGAELGLILLLFMLGLEYSAAELTIGLRRHAPAGVVDVARNSRRGSWPGSSSDGAWCRRSSSAGSRTSRRPGSSRG